MKIKFKVNTIWTCEACSYGGLPKDDEVCDMCGNTGLQIKAWIKERESINFLIDEYNKGNILIEP